MVDYVNKIINTAHYIYDKGLVPGKAGNISMIDDDREHIYITATGSNFRQLDYKDVIYLKIEDKSYENKKSPSMESNLHIGIYEKRTDINSIIHVHSPYVTGFAFSDMKLKQLEGFGPITNKYVKTVDYFKPGSDKLASHVKEACGEDNSLILKNHGLICYEKNMDEAILLTEYIEKIAKTQFISHMLNL